MAQCDYCGATILFGGVKENGLRFCNQQCQQQGIVLAGVGDIAEKVPQDLLIEHVNEIHQGLCPRCGSRGPVDLHTSYTIWSALVVTSWQSKPQICCRHCGIKSKLGGAVFSSIFGWWAFPGGFFTPFQILRNLGGIFLSPDPSVPSEKMQNFIRINLAVQLFELSQQQQQHEDE
jgi:DNA-directed RNA polymerase subunit RPC12/RpoP